MRKLILAALILALLLTAGCSAAPATQTEATAQPEATAQAQTMPAQTETAAQSNVALSQAKTGDTLADFDVTLLNGGSAKLSDYRGKVVLLNFWATWCHYCIEEMPAFQQLKKTYGDDLVVLAIDADATKQEQVDAKDFVASSGYDFVFGIDTAGLGNFLAGIPYSVVIDPDGVVTYTQSGSKGDDTFDIFSGYISTALGK